MAEESVFTKIIKGEIPSHKVYEDDKTIAIIPLNPIAVGHILVIPKTQIDQFYDLEDDDYMAVMATVKKIAKRLKQVFNTKRVGLQVVGLDVPHAHIHVIAFDTLDQFREVEDMSATPDHDKFEQIAEKLRFKEKD